MTGDAPLKGYRLVRREHADTAFSGYGAFKFGGRWNSVGRTCVYLAEHESLAMLEVLVHANAAEILEQFALFEIELLPDLVLMGSNLPANWRSYPAPHSTVAYGDQWLESQTSLGLKLPSAIVPREWNYLLNADHPGFKAALQTVKELPFSFDPRLKT